MYKEDRAQKAFAHNLTTATRQSRGEGQPLVEKKQEEKPAEGEGQEAGTGSDCVPGWHLANTILVHVCETKETTFRWAVETEGSQPREQTFVSPVCHQQ